MTPGGKRDGMHVNEYLHKCLHHKIHPGKQHCKGAHTKKNIHISALPHADTPTPALAKLVWSRDPKHRNRGGFAHRLRRLETTAVRQPEKIRLGSSAGRVRAWWRAGYQSSHSFGTGCRKARRILVYCKWPGQIGGSEFAFDQTT